MAKALSSLESSSGTKSENKLSKNTRDALKKRMVVSESTTMENAKKRSNMATNQEKEHCNRFIIVNEYMGISVTPNQFNSLPTGDPQDPNIDLSVGVC